MEEELNQILLINRIILSLIILIITFILSKDIFKKGKNLDLNKEKEKWKEKGGIEEGFLEFKKYDYNQAFWLVAFETGFSIFFSGIILGFMNILVSFVGWLPYLTLLICNFYIISKFCIKIVPLAHNRAVTNIKFLILERDAKKQTTNLKK